MFYPMTAILSFLTKNKIDGYMVFISDEHDNEYIGDHDKILEQMTGFTGSNGYAVILKDSWVLYTDSRYFVQAERELKDGFRLMRIGEDQKVSEFLNEKDAKRIGFDPKIISESLYKSLSQSLNKCGIEFVEIEEEPDVWNKRPDKIFKKIESIENQKFDYSVFDGKGKKRADEIYNSLEKSEKKLSTLTEPFARKIQKVRDFLNDGEGYIITLLDSIAWIFNLRGNDIPFNPVFYSYAYITKEKAFLYVNSEIELDGVEIRPYRDFIKDLKLFAEKRIYASVRVSHRIAQIIGDKLKFTNFVENLKSVKTPEEIMGFLRANIYDGAALVELFGWLENNIDKKVVTEKDVSAKLSEIKSKMPGFLYPSFETIAAYGASGAEVHHRSGDTQLRRDSLLLLDSGSQYVFGTTDITRTVHFGTPSDDQMVAYTRVLQGQLAAQMLKAPADRISRLIQDIPRIHLWRDEKDYGHGTSHGVGFYLNVHEAPPSFNGDELVPMQVFSIEPGLYEEGWGVRIEDVFVSVRSGRYLEPIILSFVPLHLSLVRWDLLSREEIEHLDRYSRAVYDFLRDYVTDEAGLTYLKNNTNIGNFINKE